MIYENVDYMLDVDKVWVIYDSTYAAGTSRNYSYHYIRSSLILA